MFLIMYCEMFFLSKKSFCVLGIAPLLLVHPLCVLPQFFCDFFRACSYHMLFATVLHKHAPPPFDVFETCESIVCFLLACWTIPSPCENLKEGPFLFLGSLFTWVEMEEDEDGELRIELSLFTFLPACWPLFLILVPFDHL